MSSLPGLLGLTDGLADTECTRFPRIAGPVTTAGGVLRQTPPRTFPPSTDWSQGQARRTSFQEALQSPATSPSSLPTAQRAQLHPDTQHPGPPVPPACSHRPLLLASLDTPPGSYLRSSEKSPCSFPEMPGNKPEDQVTVTPACRASHKAQSSPTDLKPAPPQSP